MEIENPRNSDIPALRNLWKQAFGDSDAFLDGFFATGYSPERCRCLKIQGELGAAVYWFDTSCRGQRFAYLYALATESRLRNRGLAGALITDTQEHLKRKGYHGTVLVPGEPGLRPFYQGLGYEDCGGVESLSIQAGEIPGFVREIETETYARLRRRYLPKGGVVQEGVSLNYLATFAQFYAGKDFLLAARQEGKNLLGLELLGNPQAAPGILRALGHPAGTFQIPGKAPFAMWHPLTKTAQPPAYFGLDLGKL